MNGILTAAMEVSAFLAERGWQHCVIGGLAVQHWAEPRSTRDADMTLLADWGSEEAYARALTERFESRIANPPEFAARNRIILLRASNGTPVDIALGALPFEFDMVERAVQVDFADGSRLPCCAAEDLFIMKVFAARPRDWMDAENIATRQTSMDKDYILRQLTDLCEMQGRPDNLERAMKLLRGNP
jgi:hypothetical protein